MAKRFNRTHIVSIACALITAAAVLSAAFVRSPSQQTISGNNNLQVGAGATLTLAQLQPGNPTVGNDSVVMGDYNGNVGDRSVVIRPPQGSTNVMLNQPGAYGYRACAGPGSLAVGAYAGAGCGGPSVSSPR
jgi:hypothetical protein